MSAITMREIVTKHALALGITCFVAIALGVSFGYSVAGPWVEGLLGR